MRGAIMPSLNFPVCRQAGLLLFSVNRKKKDEKHTSKIIPQTPVSFPHLKVDDYPILLSQRQ